MSVRTDGSKPELAAGALAHLGELQAGKAVNAQGPTPAVSVHALGQPMVLAAPPAQREPVPRGTSPAPQCRSCGPSAAPDLSVRCRGGALKIDSPLQTLFIIPSTDTDMCLLKGDTVPLTLTPCALVIWDASPGSSGVTFRWARGEGLCCAYL